MLKIKKRTFPLEVEGRINRISADLNNEETKSADQEDALVEIAELLAEQDDALIELANLIGGGE